MPRFRKKPVVVEAVKLTRRVIVQSPEGRVVGNPDDWLVTGTVGEQYVVAKDIFPTIYDPVEE